MDLALNNLKRVDMPLNKETKPNQPKYSFFHEQILDMLENSKIQDVIDPRETPQLRFHVHSIKICFSGHIPPYFKNQLNEIKLCQSS